MAQTNLSKVRLQASTSSSNASNAHWSSPAEIRTFAILLDGLLDEIRFITGTRMALPENVQQTILISGMR